MVTVSNRLFLVGLAHLNLKLCVLLVQIRSFIYNGGYVFTKQVVNAGVTCKAGFKMKCSFQTFSSCHQKTLTSKRHVKIVNPKNRAILARRLRLEQSKIINICAHHEEELLVRLKFKSSATGSECCNPLELQHKLYEKHKGAKYRKISEEFMRKYNLQGLVKEGDKICDKCRKVIEREIRPSSSGLPSSRNSSQSSKLKPTKTSSASSTTGSATTSSASPGETVQLAVTIEASGGSPIRKRK